MNIEEGIPLVKFHGLNTDKACDLNGVTIDTSGNTVVPGSLTTTGVTTGPFKQTVTFNALVGATVVLTAAMTGGVFINRSTSGSPSWTLPTAAAGLVYTFVVSSTSAGFTVTGGTIKAKTSATGTAISGTTLTNTQGTAVVGDTITLICDGTNWVATSQSGIFAAAE